MDIFWAGIHRFEIVPSSAERYWITNTDRAAYKCLPLRTANQLGWQILSPCDVEFVWDGGTGVDAISISCSDPLFSQCIISHFKHGLVSFVINAIFRTSENHQTFITGPLNMPKEGASPLSAIIETHWLPFHFAMTWKLITPHRNIQFYAGEPFAQFFEIGPVCEFDREIRHFSVFDDPALLKKYSDFLSARKIDSTTYIATGKPQRPLGFYERGEYADGTRALDRCNRSSPSVRAEGDEF